MFQVSTHHWSSQSALFPKQWSDCPKARAAKVKGPQWLNEESPHDHFIARAWTLAQISASSLRRALLSVWASLTCMHFPLLLLSAQCRLRPRLNCVPTRRQNTDHQNHQTQIGLKISLEVHVFQAPARLQTALPILQTYNLSIFFFLTLLILLWQGVILRYTEPTKSWGWSHCSLVSETCQHWRMTVQKRPIIPQCTILNPSQAGFIRNSLNFHWIGYSIIQTGPMEHLAWSHCHHITLMW